MALPPFLAILLAQDIGQAIAEKAEANAGEADCQAGQGAHPPALYHEGTADGDQSAPFRRGGLNAQAQEAHGCAGQHAHDHIAGRENDGGRDHVGQHMPQQDARVGEPGHPGCLDEFGF